MSWNLPPPLTRPPLKRLILKHKVFISFHHKDMSYKLWFEQLFGHLFINKSVKLGGIASDISNVYIKRLIREAHITDASVLIVLVGAETYCRKHVDWEIAAALSKKAGGYSGLLGIRLPTHPDFGNPVYFKDSVPSRLVDNLESGYAKFYEWTEDAGLVKGWIEDAFRDRIAKAELVQNWRLQFRNDRCG